MHTTTSFENQIFLLHPVPDPAVVPISKSKPTRFYQKLSNKSDNTKTLFPLLEWSRLSRIEIHSAKLGVSLSLPWFCVCGEKQVESMGDAHTVPNLGRKLGADVRISLDLVKEPRLVCHHQLGRLILAVTSLEYSSNPANFTSEMITHLRTPLVEAIRHNNTAVSDGQALECCNERH